LCVAFCAAASPLRVAVFAPEDSDAAALVAAEVSKLPDVEVVERGQIKLLLGEQGLGDASRERLALGRILAADFLLLVEPKQNAFAWIDATTGEELARIRKNSEKELAQSAVALVGKGRAATSANPFTAAVWDDSATKLAGDGIRDWLHARGVRVLDRELAHDVLDERTSIERGLREKLPNLPAFPGAKLLLKIQPAAEGFRIEALASDGTLLGLSPIWNGGGLSSEVQSFLVPMLADFLRPAAASSFRQRLNIEALQPFYKGVSLYESGKPLEATAEFQRAYEINNLFAAAYLWEARCYEAAGLPEFAAAIRRWLETGFAGRGVAAGADASPRDGVTFLGVNAGEEKASSAATRLSMAAIDVLSGPGLLLPESLGTIRDEYDLLSATTHTEGARWETSSGFVSRFTLRGRLHGDSCEWVLSDSLSGKVLASRLQKLPPDPSCWAEDLREFLPTFSQSASNVAASSPFPVLSLPSKAVALASVNTARGSADKNVALLQLLLIDPTDSVVIGGRIINGSDEKDGLDNYMAHAKRDVLLRLMPKAHPMRPWIELDRIQTFMPWTATGPHVSGEAHDSQADLMAFSQANANHPAGILARFFWLYDAQAKLPPAEVATEASALSRRLAAARDLPNSTTLSSMCDAISWAGSASARESGMQPGKNDVVPQRFIMEINERGEVQTRRNDRWRVSEFREFTLSPDEVRNEAGVALAIQGRGDSKTRVDPAWMDRFPHSISLASYIAWYGIHELLYPDGRPFFLDGDSNSMRRHWKRMVDYSVDAFEYWLGKVRTPGEFDSVDCSLMFLLPALNETAFRLSDKEYESIHARLLAASAAAAARVGVSNKAHGTRYPYMIDWRQLTREEADKQSSDSTTSGPWLYLDIPAFSEAIHKAAAEAFDQEKPVFRNWWKLMNQGLHHSMSYREIASKFVTPHLSQIRSLYGKGSLSDDERAMLLDVGIVLMWGWQFPEAEKIFSIVADAPSAVTSNERISGALRASALLHLARLHVQAKNQPAAIETLNRCLKLSDGLNVRHIQRCEPNFQDWITHSPGQRANIRSLAMRMLDELRFDPSQAVFPSRCGVVRIETQQLENPTVTIFYRLPPPSTVPPRVLVILPPFNEGVAGLCDDTQPWARFADTHHLALVVPQFFQVNTCWKIDHPCSPYHFPNIWAGQVLFDGIQEIGKLQKLDAGKLIFHGVGAGAQFASRFARWKPDRTGALSLHSAGGYSWAEHESGIQANSALKGLPILLTVGERDDFGSDNWDDRAGTEIYNAILKGAGACVDFHVLDSSRHRAAYDLQELSEKFIASQLPAPKQVP